MSYLAKFAAIPVLLLTMNGCAFFKTTAEKEEYKYVVKKTKLERKIELLRLERRKLMLEQSLDRMDSTDPTLEDKQS